MLRINRSDQVAIFAGLSEHLETAASAIRLREHRKQIDSGELSVRVRKRQRFNLRLWIVHIENSNGVRIGIQLRIPVQSLKG